MNHQRFNNMKERKATQPLRVWKQFTAWKKLMMTHTSWNQSNREPDTHTHMLMLRATETCKSMIYQSESLETDAPRTTHCASVDPRVSIVAPRFLNQRQNPHDPMLRLGAATTVSRVKTSTGVSVQRASARDTVWSPTVWFWLCVRAGTGQGVAGV